MRLRTTHSLIAVGAEQARVVAFLYHDVGDAWLILLLKAYTGLTDGQQLIIQHLRKEKKRLDEQTPVPCMDSYVPFKYVFF